MSIGTIMGLALTGLFALFVVVGIFVGGIRGAKKAGIRLGTIVITLILALLLTTVISKALATFNISFLHLRVNGTTATTVTQFVNLTLQNMLKNYSGIDTTALTNLAVAVSIMLINTIVFPVLFLVLRYLLLPIYWIICKLLFGKNKKDKKDKLAEVESKDKKEDKDKKDTKGKKEKDAKAKADPQIDEEIEDIVQVGENKHTALGAFVGGLSGLLIATVVFSPIVGYATIAQTVENATKDSNGKGVISSFGGSTATEIIDGYSSSPYYYLTKYTGLQWVSSKFFDSVATVNINGNKVKINSEVKTIASAYKDVVDVANGFKNAQNITQAQLNRYVLSIKRLTNLLYDSKLIVSVGDVAMPIAVDYLDKINLNSISNEYARDLFSACITVAKTYKYDDARNAINNFLSVAEVLNNHELLLPIVRRKVDGIGSVANKVTKELADQVMTDLFNIDIVSNVAIEATNFAVNYLSKAVDIEYEQATGLTKETAKTALTNIISSFADAFGGINTNSFLYYNEDDVEKLGVLLDSVKNSEIITTNTYNNLVNKLEDKLRQTIDNMNVGSTIRQDLKLAVDKLSDVDNWTAEFVKVHKVVKQLNLALTKDGLTLEKEIENFSFSHLGKALDELKTTTMFDQEISGVEYTCKLVNDAIDWLTADKLGEIGDQIDETISGIQANVLAVTSWEQALGGAGDLIIKIKEIAGSDDIIGQFRTNETLVRELGAALDTADGTPLFANNVVRTLMKEVLDLMQEKIVSGDSTSTDTALTNVISDMKGNIDAASSINWQQSLVNVRDLIVVAQDLANGDNIVDRFKSETSTLATDLGRALDKAEKTPLFITGSTNVAKTFVLSMLDIVSDSVTTSENASMIAAAITQMKANINDAGNIEQSITWEGEFSDFKLLFGCDLDEIDIDGEEITTLTRRIDTIITRNHIIIKNNVINAMLDEMISNALDALSAETRAEYGTALDNIQTRAQTLQGAVYEAEIGYLKSLRDTLDDTSVVSGVDHNVANIDFANTAQLTYFGGRFDAIKNSTLVGATGYDIISKELNDYIDRKDEEEQTSSGDPSAHYEYRPVLLAVRTNLNSLDNETLRKAQSNYYTNIFVAFGDVANNMNVSVDADNLTTSATSIENLLVQKQANMLIKYNGAKEIATIAMNKVKDIIDDKIDEANNNTGLTPEVQAEVVGYLNDAKDYANDYITYLGTITGNQPYGSATQETAQVGGHTIRINKPFGKVAEIIKQATDILDNY